MMLSVGIGEIQKNSSIFSNLKERMLIVDKRKKCTLAIVYPIKKRGNISKLAGKYKNRIKPSNLTQKQIREKAFETAMKDKYDLSY